MRLLALDLEKYGLFSSRRLRFRPDARLHVVYGRNEAGKTTTLAGVRDMLFGFPDGATPYDFLHRANELRIGGEIEDAGRTLAFMRRKGRKRTLLDSTGNDLPDDALGPFLHGLSKALFDRAFGLDAARLRAGADDLFAADGEVGQSVAAAAGLRGVTALRQQLDVDADAIFAPRAAKERRFYQALERYETARKAIGEHTLRSDDWKKLNEEIEAHAAALAQMQVARSAIKRQVSRLDRLQRLSPLVAGIDRLAADITALGALPDMPTGYAARLGAALDAIAAAQARFDTAAETAADSTHELESITLDQGLLDHAGDIVALFRNVGSYRAAQRDRPRIQKEVEDHDADILRLAADLGLRDADGVQESQPSIATQAAVRKLIRDGDDLAKRLESLDQTITREREGLIAHQREAEARGMLVDPAPLREKLLAFGNVSALAERSAQEAAETVAETRLLDEEAKRLTPPIRDLDAFAAVSLPDAAAIARHRRALDDAAEAERAARSARHAAQAEVTRLERVLSELAAGHPVPTPESIRAARDTRDAAWVPLRATLFGDTVPDAATLAGSVAHFETAIAAADQLADAAARDATRVAAHVAAENDLALRRGQLSVAEQALAAAQATHADCTAAWQHAWQTASLAPLPPAEMTLWLAGARALLDRRAKLLTRLSALKRDEGQLERLAGPLAALAAEAGLAPLAGLDAPLSAVRIEERIKELARAWDGARDAQTRQRETEKRLADLERDHETLTGRIQDWRGAWHEAMPAIGLEADAMTEAAGAALEAWARAPRLVDERNNRAGRVTGMTRDMAQFEDGTAALVATLAPHLSRLAAPDAIETLHDALTEARQLAARHTELSKRNRADATAQEAAQRAVDKAAATLEPLAAPLPEGADPADMHARLGRREQALAALADLRAQFAAHADGHDEAQIRAELAQYDADLAESERQSLDEEEARLDAAAKEAFAGKDRCERRRIDLERGIGAELALQQRMNAETELVAAAREWTVLKIASDLLGGALARAREAHRDPLIARASAIFAGLTGGSFHALDRRPDEDDIERLAGLRPDGKSLKVHEMSEGTRDQLYLALRLAHIETYADGASAPPFIGDDIFTSFDDARTGVGLEALAALSPRVQPILFTHHNHVVDIARDRLGDGLDLIELG